MNGATVLILVSLLGGAAACWRRGAWGMPIVCGLVAALPAVTLVRTLPLPALVLVAVPVAIFGWNRWTRTSATVTRWGARSRRKAGVATSLDVARVGSGLAVRRKRPQIRQVEQPIGIGGDGTMSVGIDAAVERRHCTRTEFLPKRIERTAAGKAQD